MRVVSRQSSIVSRQSSIVSRQSADCRGYTIVELMVSTAIMLTVTGAIFSLMNPAQGSAQVQPEVADLQQRVRVASETLFKEIVMAGAGPYQGATTGSLINFFAPILPRRSGKIAPDAPEVFRTDAITLVYIPNSYSQTTLSSSMPPTSAELKVNDQKHCPKTNQLCGFEEGMDVILFDSTGNFDTFHITEVQTNAGHLQHNENKLTHTYDVNSNVTQIVSNSFFLDTATKQLMRDSAGVVVPIVDNVVDLKFEYFGDATAPTNPKPPAGVENCLYDSTGNYLAPMTLTPDDGSLVVLTEAILTDGPFCGGGANAFDVDLLRIRKVRVTLRLQASSPTFRGGTDKDGNLRQVSGGERYISDYSVSFEVAPRNLNLVR